MTKIANLVVIGGPIAVGKSTQIDLLDFPSVEELDKRNSVQNILLGSTYSKERADAETIEYYFFKNRIMLYKKFANTKNLHIFDRSIFESLWFAKRNLSKASYIAFHTLWEKEIESIIAINGIPKQYIILDMKWDTFKERIYARGRNEELKNFSKNEVFFKNHVNEFSDFIVDICKIYKIEYTRIQTDQYSEKEIYELIMDVINER